MQNLKSRLTAGRQSSAGFSLIELLTVIGIALVLIATCATYVITNGMPGVRANSALQSVVSQLRQARSSAVDERRDFLVTFKGTNEILVQRQEVNLTTGAVTGTTQIADTFIPAPITFTVISGVPDTPDALTNSGSVSGFGCTGNTTPCTLTFQSDGTVLSATTAAASGTISFAVAGTKNTQRAVTIMGATGRIKGYSFNGTNWH